MKIFMTVCDYLFCLIMALIFISIGLALMLGSVSYTYGYIILISFWLTIIIKATLNARYRYRKCLKGRTMFGGKIADSIFILRQAKKQRRRYYARS